jgi:hypothetical protein
MVELVEPESAVVDERRVNIGGIGLVRDTPAMSVSSVASESY